LSDVPGLLHVYITGCGINPARTFGPAVMNSIAGNNVWQGITGLIAFYIAPFSASIVVGSVMPLFWGGKSPPKME
jgi:glycerol uptake facilitator-like aquaporin